MNIRIGDTVSVIPVDRVKRATIRVQYVDATIVTGTIVSPAHPGNFIGYATALRTTAESPSNI